MKFCSLCGHSVRQQIPENDNRQRFVCQQCGEIHYQNPKIVVGTIPMWEDQIILCRRAIEPRQGMWTLPAGFLELNETSAQGAYRETLEEAGTDVEIGSLFSIVNIAHIGQIHWFYLANMPSASFSPVTSESLEVRLFRESEIPWNELAFLTVKLTLEHFFADQKKQAITFDQVMPTYLLNINPTQRSAV